MELVGKKPQKRVKRREFPNSTTKLSPKAVVIRKRVLAEWSMTDSDIVLLDKALSYSDLADRYQAMLDRDGLALLNERTGACRPNPALSALKAARAAFLASWRMLDLRDAGQKRPPGRPEATYPAPED